MRQGFSTGVAISLSLWLVSCGTAGSSSKGRASASSSTLASSSESSSSSGGSGGGSSGPLKVFLTTSASNGSMGGINGADSACASDPNKPDAHTYKALIVDSTTRVACTTANCSTGSGEHVNWVLAPSTTYYKSDGTTASFTTDSVGLITTISSPPTATFTGVWTGLNMNWTTSSTANCTNWTDPSNSVQGRYGNAGATAPTSSLFSTTQTTCSNQNRILCVEQ